MRAYDPWKHRWLDVEIDLPEPTEALVACPTFFDMHTHVRLNGQEDYDSLERAAIAGGFGAVLIQPNTKPELFNLDVLNFHIQLAKDKIVDFYWSVSLFGELEPDGKGTLCYSNDGIEYDTLKILNAFRRKNHILCWTTVRCTNLEVCSTNLHRSTLQKDRSAAKPYPSFAT